MPPVQKTLTTILISIEKASRAASRHSGVAFFFSVWVLWCLRVWVLSTSEVRHVAHDGIEAKDAENIGLEKIPARFGGARRPVGACGFSRKDIKIGLEEISSGFAVVSRLPNCDCMVCFRSSSVT